MRTFLIIITTVFVTTVIVGLAQRFYDRVDLDRQYAAGYGADYEKGEEAFYVTVGATTTTPSEVTKTCLLPPNPKIHTTIICTQRGVSP